MSEPSPKRCRIERSSPHVSLDAALGGPDDAEADAPNSAGVLEPSHGPNDGPPDGAGILYDDAPLPTTLELTEHPDVAKLEWVVGHPDVYQFARGGLSAYARAAGAGKLTVTYERRGPGRLYPLTSKTVPRGPSGTLVTVATQQSRPVRAALFGDTHLDVDLVNCHPRLLHGLVRDCPKIDSDAYTHLTE
jgi:hypothetical protein